MEANFDGLVGPTHNYGGLSFGNVASTTNRARVSNPKEAALQGLKKMKYLADRGLAQGVFPPHERPYVPALRRLGFEGNDAEVVRRAAKEAPAWLAQCSSAAVMFAANHATVIPAPDSSDGKTHFIPANLASKFHRSFEAPTNARILKAIFGDDRHFTHHPWLPHHPDLGDEGAANHTRLAASYSDPGLHIFVYGRSITRGTETPKIFPARQTDESSKAVARFGRLSSARALFIQQNPAAIDAGAFHNDVVSVGNQNIFFYHEEAFLEADTFFKDLRSRWAKISQAPLLEVRVRKDEVTLADAVKSYLFNSQLITLPSGESCLIAPSECDEISSVSRFLSRHVGSGCTINQSQTFNLRQSMQNGGGPACLRLRVILGPEARAAVKPTVWLSDELFGKLSGWVNRHYRDKLEPGDLADPKLWEESCSALDELTQILDLGSIYPFQRGTNLGGLSGT